MKILKIKYAAAMLLIGAFVPTFVHAFSLQSASIKQVSQSSAALDPHLTALTIPGDYTLTYAVQRKDLLTPEQRKVLRDKLYQDLLDSPFHPVSKTRYKPGDAVPPDVAARANAVVDQSLNPESMSQPMTLTISTHAGKFLYQLLSQHSDLTSFVVGDAAAPIVMLYGGSKSFLYGYSDHRTMLWNSFDGGDLEFMPVLSTHMSDVAIFKDVKSLGGGDYRGKVFDPGDAGSLQKIRLSYANTKVHLEKADGLPRMTEVSILNPDNTVAFSTKATAFVLFKGVWVPSQLIKKVNSQQFTWTLTHSSPNAVDPTLFDYNTYLKQGDVIQDNTNPKGPQIITYVPGMDVFAQWH